MKIKINRKNINIIEFNSLFQKFKGLKFYLKPINNIYRFKSHYANTYFLCQRVDIVMTDNLNNILYIYKNVKTEKLILFKRKVKYVYFLPIGYSNNLKLNTKLNIIEEKKVND